MNFYDLVWGIVLIAALAGIVALIGWIAGTLKGGF